jgi:pimeloyl-ACP methyl ester carboxylesterase
VSQSQIAQTPKGQIEYVIKGTGKPCLLLHGGHSNCFEAFGTEEIIAAGMSALIPSRPGYGKTSASVGKTASEAADLMIALLDELSIPKVSVVAVSAAGPTALYLAAKYPERIDKLVLESAVTKRWLTPDDAVYKTGYATNFPATEPKAGY